MKFQLSKSSKTNLIYWGTDEYPPSVTEATIKSVLQDLDIEFYREVSFERLVNPKTMAYYRFDFYIPILDLIIEYDGKHHRKACHKKTDKVKDKFCKNNGLHVVRFNSDDYHQLYSKVMKFVKSRIKGKSIKQKVIHLSPQEELHLKLGIEIDFILTKNEIKILNKVEGSSYLHLKIGSLKKTEKNAIYSLLKKKVIEPVHAGQYKIVNPKE